MGPSGLFLIYITMKFTEEERDSYVMTNHSIRTYNHMSKITGWSKNTIIKVKAKLELSGKLKKAKLVELVSTSRYVMIPELRARVKLREGVTPEMYLATLDKFKEGKFMIPNNG